MLVSEIKPIGKFGKNMLENEEADELIYRIIEKPLQNACKACKDKNIETGDEITFTRISKVPGKYEYYISMKKSECTQFCYVRAKQLYVILKKELLPSNSDNGSLTVTKNGKEVVLSYEFVENNTLRDAATTIVGDSTAKALSFSLYNVRLGSNIPKANMSLMISGDKYIVIEEKHWEFHDLNN